MGPSGHFFIHKMPSRYIVIIFKGGSTQLRNHVYSEKECADSVSNVLQLWLSAISLCFDCSMISQFYILADTKHDQSSL